MQQPFIHYSISQLEQVLADISDTHHQYTERNVQFFNLLESVLKKCSEMLQQMKRMDFAQRITSLVSDLHTLNRGYHPYLFEKLEHPKRDIQFTIGLKILKEAEMIILDEYQQYRSKLSEAEPLTQNLLLAAWQMGTINARSVRSIDTQHELEQLWNRLGNDHALSTLQKKIILSTSRHDALVLLDLGLSKLK